MPPGNLAQLLMRKAAQDAYAVRKLIEDPESPDEIIGFHAQQAVEKLLKAVLAAHGVKFRRTHDLVELIDLLVDNRLPFTQELDEVRNLTPFAVEYRYGEFFSESETYFDRQQAVLYVERVSRWAESMLQEDLRDSE